MKKRTLIFDVDDVIVPDRWFPWMNEYLAKLGKPTYESKNCFKVFNYLTEVFKTKEELEPFLDFFYSYDTYKGLKPIEGAVDGLRKLGETDRIRLATSCTPYRAGPDDRRFLREYADKNNWIMDNLSPFYDYKETIAISGKDSIHGFSMTDDKLSNLSGNFERKIMFPAWHNRDVTQEELQAAGAVKANNWDDILEMLK